MASQLFSDIDPASRFVWAKSADDVGHSLLCHMLDVAAVSETVIQRESLQTRSWIAKEFGLPVDVSAGWISRIVGLHDFGKAIPGFQAKWEPGKNVDINNGLPFKHAAQTVNRHDLAGAALLRRLLLSEFPGAGWVSPVVQALGAHHGYMPSSIEIKEAAPRNEGAVWVQARQALFNAYWATFEPVGEPSSNEIGLPAVAWLAGLASVADWIGSNQEWFPPGERHTTLEGHYSTSKELAEQALDEIGWPYFHTLLGEPLDPDALVGRILAQSRTEARPLQRTADRLLSNATGPTLMIVEAPMGEGKTELAFLAYLRLQSINAHRGLYVALPTQATGNAMFERTLKILGAFAPGAGLDIQLVHGAASLDERVHKLRNIDASEREAVYSSAWFSQRKRPLLSPYGVGTIDQSLFATLNVKHHFVRLWGLANRVVVLDEVHAYDTYTSSLIEALLRWLQAMNCSVVLMSATLPTRRRADFLQAWGAPEAPNLPYPRILMTVGTQIFGESVNCRTLLPIAVSGISEDLESIAKTAMDLLVEGGCGVVIVNTVQRAQDLYLFLRNKVDSDTDLLLFHARYPADERSKKERWVLDCFGCGKNANRPARALLVATQVVEQSLDIDFDFMISDLAPVDLLLQRAGRLHRHERERPKSHHEPRLIVAGLQQNREPELKETAWGFVYDPYILYRTWCIAKREPVWRLPQDIDRLVQTVYASDFSIEQEREEFVKTLDSAFGEHLALIQEHRQRAMNVAIDAGKEPQNAYSDKPKSNEQGEGGGLQVTTRIGEESITVVPIFSNKDGWRLFPEESPFDPAATIEDGLAKRLYHRHVRLNRKGVVKALTSQPAPEGFEMHPLLRNLKPLPLQEGAAVFGNLRVGLSPELGITYEQMEEA